jgi:hypothetical protein
LETVRKRLLIFEPRNNYLKKKYFIWIKEATEFTESKRWDIGKEQYGNSKLTCK